MSNLQNRLLAGLVAGLIAFSVSGFGQVRFVGGWAADGKNNDTSGGRPHFVTAEGEYNATNFLYTEGVTVDEDTVRTARETATHGGDSINWTNSTGFERDVWAFARIKYQYNHDPDVSFTASPWGWITDYPDSDLNLSYRVQQMTSIKVDPDGRTLFLQDPGIFDYPWIYMVEPGRMRLRDEEVPILRKYLLNGGVLMVDDFWGKMQWDNFARQIARVFPGREFTELQTNHPLFHCVFDLNVPLNKLQTPNSALGKRSLRPGEDFGVTYEGYHDDYGYHHDRNEYGFGDKAAHDMHVRALLDEKGRIMVIATHNCDNGDGWEREGEDDLFFHEFSEKRAFPLGINIIFYTMTH
jgi:hypothetical protein